MGMDTNKRRDLDIRICERRRQKQTSDRLWGGSLSVLSTLNKLGVESTNCSSSVTGVVPETRNKGEMT